MTVPNNKRSAGHDGKSKEVPKEIILNDRYEPKKILAEGSFGTLIKAADRSSGKEVAIKIPRSKRDKRMLNHEHKILKIIQNNQQENKDHLLSLHDFFYFKGFPCMVTEYIPISLYDLLNKRKIHLEEVAKIGYSLLLALEALSQMVEKSKIVHGDIKPANIMFTEHGRLKLVDYGLSFLEVDQNYEFCQSLYYRAPEVYLYDEFGTAIDVWSVGCIVAECYTNKVLFDSSTKSHHLRVMAEYLGMIPDNVILQGKKSPTYFSELIEGGWIFRKTLDPFEGPRSKSLYTYIGEGLSTDYVGKLLDLLNKMFEYDPAKRITVKEALQHEFFADCRGATPLIFATDS